MKSLRSFAALVRFVSLRHAQASPVRSLLVLSVWLFPAVAFANGAYTHVLHTGDMRMDPRQGLTAADIVNNWEVTLHLCNARSRHAGCSHKTGMGLLPGRWSLASAHSSARSTASSGSAARSWPH